jgi:hypothetical protein
MKMRIYLKQVSDGQWKYGKILDASQIIRWTSRSWPTRAATIQAAERDFPDHELNFQDEENEQ